jgi:serine/threonine protein kinase
MSGVQPGTLLMGKYRVERELGSGGMGVVLEATHVALGQTVAVKLLNAQHAQSSEVVARFLREAQIAATLPSEHIARVSDVGMTDSGAPYIVMERLVGRDLDAELLQRRTLPIAEAVDLMLEACEGVAMAHAHGLVHRDLKPANLFLAERPLRPRVLKVLDFGLSKDDNVKQGALTGTDTVFGTPQYMSPEQIQSAKNVDARSDQHALGMILYEMLAGQPPFTAESVTQLIVVIATRPPPHVRAVRPDVPVELDAALVRTMAKQAADRFADLGAFARAIAPYGGPDARTRAELVVQALSVSGVHVDPNPSKSSRVPTDDAITLPHGVSGFAETHAAVTRPMIRSDERERNKRTVLVVAAALLFCSVAIALVVVVGFGADAPVVVDGASSASVAAANPVPDRSPAPTAVVTPSSTTEASTTEASPGASTTSTAHTKTTKTTKPIKATSDSIKTSVEKFGVKRK